MNNAKSVVGGWAAFFGFTMTGATLGYFRWRGENAIRVVEAVELKKQREEDMERIFEKRRLQKAAAQLEKNTAERAATAALFAAANPPAAVPAALPDVPPPGGAG